MRNVIFHPLAEQELLDAIYYYEKQETGLGLDYLDGVEHAVNFLVRYPEAGAKVKGTIRRLTLPKFPYSLLYRVAAEHIRVLAVAHHKRRPKYWVDRQ